MQLFEFFMFILLVLIFGSAFLLQILGNTNYTAVHSVSCLINTFKFTLPPHILSSNKTISCLIFFLTYVSK